MSTKIVTVTIGYTISDMPHYSSFDGYRPGANQHTEMVSFPVPEHYNIEDVAWTLMTATNSPFVVPGAGSHTGEALAAIQATGYTGREAHWSLSKGDTVTMGGESVAFDGLDVKSVEVVPAVPVVAEVA